MKNNRKRKDVYRIMKQYGEDILTCKEMEIEKRALHHGDISCYKHTLRVTLCCISLAKQLHIKVNERDLVRGALLHDFYLYDWHIREESHRWHGFVHPRIAFLNAKKQFEISQIEEDMIRKHMFPLTVRCPVYKESIILCLCDKMVTIYEYYLCIKKCSTKSIKLSNGNKSNLAQK